MFPELNNNDITLEDVTYEWLDTCNDPKQLHKAVKLIEEDGDYFTDLKKIILDKLKGLTNIQGGNADGKAPVNSQDKQELLQDLNKWQKDLESQRSDKNTKEAESLKIKGNDALRSGDFKEAITHYNSALNLSPHSAIVLVNRSLAHFKLKDYKQSIEDASNAIKADPKYTKGYFRRAKANIELKSYLVAAFDFARILKIESGNAEVAKELAGIKNKLSGKEKEDLERFISMSETHDKTNVNQTGNKDKKVKIVIEEGSDDDEEEDELAGLKKEKADIDQKMMDGAFEQSLERYEALLKKLKNGEKRENLLFKLQVYNNIAFCYKQMQADKKVVEFGHKVLAAYLADEALHHDEEFKKIVFKALLRQAQAFERLENDIKALEAYEGLLCIYPQNIEVLTARNKTKAVCQKHYSDSFHYGDLKNKIVAQFRLSPITQANLEKHTEVVEQEKSKTEEVEISMKTEQPIEEPKVVQSEPVTEKYKLNDADLASAVAMKEKGNTAFKEKDIAGAIKFYETGLKTLLGTANVSDNILMLLDEKTIKVVVDILSNLSFAHYQNKQYKFGFEQASLGERFSHQKEKLQYRLALNGEALVKQLVEDAQKLLDADMKLKIVQSAEDVLIKTLEFSAFLYSVDQNEKMKSVAESCRVLTVILSNLKQTTESQKASLQAKQEPKVEPKQDAKKETILETKKEAINEPKEIREEANDYSGVQKPPVKKIKPDLLTKTENITKKAMDELIMDFKQPNSASQFETELNSFKDHHDKLIAYLCRQNLDNIKTLYTTKQIEIKYLLKINTAINEVKELDDPSKDKLVGLFDVLALSKNFKLTIKMLLKKEKQQLADLFEKLRTGDDTRMAKLRSEYGLSN